MPPQNTDGLIRMGILALPLAGILALVGQYGTLKLGSGGILATGDNRAIVGDGYFASQLVGKVLALTLLSFGVVALFAYLANGGERVLALAAMVLSIIGIALIVSGMGVYAYSVPALSRAFLDGNLGSIAMIDSIFAGPFGTMLILAFLLYSAGFILIGVAIWRSGVLPGLAGVLVAVQAPLISGPFSVVESVVGSLLAAVGGGWIALSVLRSPPARGGSRSGAARQVKRFWRKPRRRDHRSRCEACRSSVETYDAGQESDRSCFPCCERRALAPPERAGSASALLESGTEFGGALGMAILGSIGAAVYRGEVAGVSRAGVPSEAGEAAHDTLGGAVAAADGLLDALAVELLDASREAFTQALLVTAVTSATIVLGIAILGVVLLRDVRAGSKLERQPDRRPARAGPSSAPEKW